MKKLIFPLLSFIAYLQIQINIDPKVAEMCMKHLTFKAVLSMSVVNEKKTPNKSEFDDALAFKGRFFKSNEINKFIQENRTLKGTY